MLIGWISNVVRAPTNGATLPLLTSYIAVSKKFEVNFKFFTNSDVAFKRVKMIPIILKAILNKDS